jgi:hypothetical protein
VSDIGPENDYNRGGYPYYPPEVKANAIILLRANGGDTLQTQRETGIHNATLAYWWEHQDRIIQNSEVFKSSNADLLSKLDNMSHVLVESMPGKIEDATLYQVAGAMAICIDKAQLLRGEATSILGMSNEDRAVRLAELLSRLNGRGEGPE